MYLSNASLFLFFSNVASSTQTEIDNAGIRPKDLADLIDRPVQGEFRVQMPISACLPWMRMRLPGKANAGRKHVQICSPNSRTIHEPIQTDRQVEHCTFSLTVEGTAVFLQMFALDVSCMVLGSKYLLW
ncbi:hypothetical protein ACMYSQ_007019 [Aspergillus niger]